MSSTAMKAIPLAFLLIASGAAAVPSGDEPAQKSEKKETKVVISDDGVFASDGDDEPFVWHMRHGRHGYLGIRLIEMTPELRAHYGAPKDAGVLVAGVESDSPASKAGILVGDIVTRAGGERIESGRDLTHAVRRMKSGETLKLEVSRDRAVKQLTVKIEERRSDEIDLGELSHDLGRMGREIGRDIGRDFGHRSWVFRSPESLDRFQEKLDEMDKRLKDIEKRLPAR
ncbi:MAG TPA: PDZ domain-containing protein [Thermoanaerobaculia bacterium]|nr:PDZ domain-containing protein [Thermoanaerobaculia bacterium]